MNNNYVVNNLPVEFFNFTYTLSQKNFQIDPLERYFKLHESLLNVSSNKKRVMFNGNDDGVLKGKKNN